MVLGNSYRS